jgi:hypothetical protein
MALNELFRSPTEIWAVLEPVAAELGDEEEEGVLELLPELQAAISSAAPMPAAVKPAFLMDDTNDLAFVHHDMPGGCRDYHERYSAHPGQW